MNTLSDSERRELELHRARNTTGVEQAALNEAAEQAARARRAEARADDLAEKLKHAALLIEGFLTDDPSLVEAAARAFLASLNPESKG